LIVSVFALVAIGAATLSPSYGPQGDLGFGCVFCGQRARADVLVNLVLFAPLGVGLALTRTPVARVLLVAALASAMVEGAQLIIPGRDPSLGDVIVNTAGAWLGIGLVWFVGELARLDDRAASRLSIAAALDVALAVVVTGLLVQPSFPPTRYWGQWTPNLGHLEWYRGRVQDARIAGQEVRSRRIEDSGRAREALLQGGPVEVEFTAGPGVSALASLFSVYDENQAEIFLVGPDRDDLVLRYRTRAAAFRLDQPDLRFVGGWPGLAEGARHEVRTWSPSRGEWCVSSPGGERCGLGFTVGAGWGILFYAEWFPVWLRQLLSMGWMAALLAPMAFLLRRRWESLAAVVIVAGTLAVLPGAVALRPMTPLEWIGALLGLASGLLASYLLRYAPSARVNPRLGVHQ
jgi:hypothetical protein